VNHLLPRRDVPWMPPEMADADGFVGVGGDLSPRTLWRAYCDGVFPWFNEGDPILWWSPDPRAIFELHASESDDSGYGSLHVSRRLARTIRSGKFRVTIDQCFAQVMQSCGEKREGGTWVTAEMLAAYSEMHRLGHAHSVETWYGDELAGGIYGLAIGGLFAAESMFYRVTDGSKVALAALISHLRERKFVLMDVQMKTPHTERLGAAEINRSEYLKRLRKAVQLKNISFI
jgi:leucyl/phenylalanyl-tRNA--protein transferase